MFPTVKFNQTPALQKPPMRRPRVNFYCEEVNSNEDLEIDESLSLVLWRKAFDVGAASWQLGNGSNEPNLMSLFASGHFTYE
jgi:hypothetical protein